MSETREPVGPAKEEHLSATPDASVQQSTDEQPGVRLDWSAADDVPAQRGNVVQIQFMGTEMLLTLGMVLPPIALAGMTPEQTAKYLSEHSLPVRQITKVLLSQEATTVLAGHLQQTPSPAPAEETGS